MVWWNDLLSVEGGVFLQNEPLPMLVEALKRQRDRAPCAEELRYIGSVLRCLADELVNVGSEQKTADEDEQRDALMW